MSSYALQHTPTYDECIRKLSTSNPAALVKLSTALGDFARKPFQNPQFKTHAFRGLGSDEKVFISDIGGRKGYRLIWRLVRNTIVLLLYGEHDVEERAKRLRFEEDVETGGIRIVEVVKRAQEPERQPEGVMSREPGSLFMAWTDDELARYGFNDIEVAVLRGLDELSELEQLEDRMGAESFDRSLALALYHDVDAPSEKREVAERRREEVEREVVAPQEKELERKIASPRSRKHFAPISVEGLQEVLAKPIEDWMIFLHPDQAKLTQRPFSGPARVRGAAGTGKTVVALHRARHLAATYGEKVLFTTYVTNLPKVFGQLFARLAPELDGQVEFVSLHAWAYRFVKQHGSPFQLDTQQSYSAYNEAYKRVASGSPDLDDLGWRYLREEIDWVIKGRGLQRHEDYLALARTGRGTPLPRGVRERVWGLYEEYERQLRRRRVVDFNDLLLKALELLQNGRAESPYRAVVIDEAQDLTETGLRLAYDLAGRDERDGLFMVGDGQQSVYPGGFSLSHLGIDVRGRSSLMKVNYRNTRAILDAARGVVGERPFDDGEDALDRRDVGEEVTVLRDGTAPSFVEFANEDDHDTELVAAITKVSEDPEVGLGDIAVLVPTNAMVKRYASLIRNLGLRSQKLEQYEGIPNEQVKVGTFQRRKGLEFKHVFLPRLDADGLQEAPRHSEDETAHAERMELLRRQVFVAMTRARDGLWGGWVGAPSAIIKG